MKAVGKWGQKQDKKGLELDTEVGWRRLEGHLEAGAAIWSRSGSKGRSEWSTEPLASGWQDKELSR